MLEKEFVEEQLGIEYVNGAVVKDLIIKYSISEATFYRILKRRGIPKRPTAKSGLENYKDNIVEKYLTGKGSDSLAKEYGCSPSCMLRFLKKHTEVEKKSPVMDKLNQRRLDVVSRYQSGESTYSIAKDFQTQDALIYLFLRDKCGLTMRSNNEKKFEDHKAAVKELYDDGLTIADISRKIGCGKGTARIWANNLGLDTSRYSTQRDIPLSEISDDIIKEYSNGIGCYRLAKKYSCSENSIRKIITGEGLEYGIHQRKYHFDLEYFKYIDRWDKAYSLGLWNTDGNNDTYQARISLTDYSPVKYIKDKVKTDSPIRVIEPTRKMRKPAYCLQLCSKELCDDLSNLGLIPNKTHFCIYPNIPEEFDRAYILGALDGDGCVGVNIYPKPQGERFMCQMSWTGNNLHVDGIANKIMDYLGIELKTYACKNSKDNIIVRKTGNRDEIIAICDWLYEDAEFYLERKYNNYMKIKYYQ